MSRSITAPVEIELPGADCPPDVRVWLVTRGWYVTGTNSYESFNNPRGNQCHNFTWEQAMAYEFYCFASLGGVPNGEG